MSDAMRIRAQAVGDRTTVRVLMSHEMESGQRRDETGAPVPAWYIREVSAELEGRTVMTAQWGPSVSKNPFLQFDIRGARPGDRVRITWIDNRGEQRSDEAIVR
ncbi:sulfur compound chelating protein SoxZ [Sphaerotilus hippei]|uniref:Sulfur compound chelating protein SoxZ n=1 Tax=Sphaerotilus hippei TaxID=744406 RepID=A0A318GVL7_9BURK|nr:thiosulfate oxidation carrier complex protein SoxZ [Sphaerotilus hippei]PXW93417.1 sulfur compound chelating protein SoxZ [Sphaerotilus hippei]